MFPIKYYEKKDTTVIIKCSTTCRVCYICNHNDISNPNEMPWTRVFVLSVSQMIGSLQVDKGWTVVKLIFFVSHSCSRNTLIICVDLCLAKQSVHRHVGNSQTPPFFPSGALNNQYVQTAEKRNKKDDYKTNSCIKITKHTLCVQIYQISKVFDYMFRPNLWQK